MSNFYVKKLEENPDYPNLESWFTVKINGRKGYRELPEGWKRTVVENYGPGRYMIWKGGPVETFTLGDDEIL